MRRVMAKLGVMCAVAALALTTVGSAQAQQAGKATPRQEGAAYFQIQAPPGTRDFVIKLTDPKEIQHARDLVSGTTQDRPHLLGRIVTRPAYYNPGWSFHYEPDTIHFFDVAIEVCDATTQYVEDHLDEAGGAFLPGYVWCPWSSRVIREVSP